MCHSEAGRIPAKAPFPSDPRLVTSLPLTRQSMPNGKARKGASDQTLPPLGETVQLGTRVYQALLHSIVTGQIEFGAPLRPDAIAEQLQVSTTPVREAIQRLEIDGVAIKLPYQGWFVREFTEGQIRELYEFRSGLEQLGVRLACERIT